jgi:uncharacterized ion transporter superfamily protein YfcC
MTAFLIVIFLLVLFAIILSPFILMGYYERKEEKRRSKEMDREIERYLDALTYEEHRFDDLRIKR